MEKPLENLCQGDFKDTPLQTDKNELAKSPNEIFQNETTVLPEIKKEEKPKIKFTEIKVTRNDLNFKSDLKDIPVEKKTSDTLKAFTFSDYFYGELRRDYQLENDSQRYVERRDKFYVFMCIPLFLEKFIFYGFLQCTDAFLYIFTFLPLRFLLAVVHILSIPFRILQRQLQGKEGRAAKLPGISPAYTCDLVKCALLAIGTATLMQVDTSICYHLVKSQSVIKLYIVFNMLEVIDRLFSPFGQDILDCLYWTATESSNKQRSYFKVGLHFLGAICYVVVHSGFILFQATTLNVAINSQNKALLTIMMSNNFVELKGMVFKKFEKNNLFQMSCMDVRERFHYVILLLIVVIQTLKEYNWAEGRIWFLLSDCSIVFAFEVGVDWVKHAFITKFNEIPSEVYSEYTISLAYDMASSKLKNAYSDHTDLVSRRMGFMPIPLTALLLRVIIGAISVHNLGSFVCLGLSYLCLLTLKITINLYLLGKACDHIDRHRQAMKASETRQCTSLPPTPPHHRQSLEEDRNVLISALSLPQTPQRSQTSSLEDIAAHVERLHHGAIEPNPIFSDSTVNLQQWQISPMGILTPSREHQQRRISLQTS